ncbi:uncharacterized protein K02A2.6-like [Erpetoichthys calabaricus]|uniref:uncharacterized protein K02A2.6-like n=1 Tax=Erpetoichthys calabaricus TaxID=27687 RepID=UPI002233F673|nr:uncharacterized protein K02A2.6-like [Erpetoichthys calabaricus]
MAMITGHFGPFDDSVEQWGDYTERFEFFVKANAIDDDLKVPTFLSVIAAKTFSLLRSLVRPGKPGDKSFDDIAKILDSHFSPKPLLIAERFRFHKRNQEEGESVAQYVAVLKKLTEYCEFGANLDDALRDRLVCGLRSEGLQKRLLTEANLTLQKAIEIAVSMELAAKEAQQLGAAARKENKTDSETDSEAELLIKTLNKKRGSAAYTITAMREGHPVKMEVDTGAAVSLISEKLFKKKLNHLPLKHPRIIIKTYTGESVPMLGKTKVQVELNGQRTKLPVYIVKGDYPALMGRSWLEKVQLDWTKVNAVSVEQSELNLVLRKHQAVFQEELGSITGIKVTLRVQQNCQPRFLKARSVPYALRPKVEADIDRLVKLGVLDPVSHSEWATPVVPVVKSDGSVRLCGDFKVTVNPVLIAEQYPLPVIEDIFAGLAGGNKFSKIDLSQAYLQMHVDEDSQKYLTITTHKGLYRYCRLPFGITSAPALFQRAMDQILSELPGVQCYLDDILVTGRDDKEHMANLDKTLSRLEKYGLRVNKEKCDFFKMSVEYLGHVIDSEGLHTAPSKVKAIVDAPAPSNVSQLRSFLGLVNYYGRFIPQLATLLKPLHELLCESRPWKWSQECETTFSKTKAALADKRVLTHFDPSLPIQLACDASPYGVGAVVSHIMSTGEERPIAFASRTLSKTETKYPQIEKEALSIIFGIKKFHTYLFGRKFTLLTDHRPLTSIFGSHTGVPSMAASRLQRWALLLGAHNYEIKYRRSEAHGNADGLSRLPLPDQPREQGQKIFYFKMVENAPITAHQIKQETKGDYTLSKLLTCILKGQDLSTLNALPDVQPYLSQGKELSVTAGCLMWGMRVIIPQRLRKPILDELHLGHCGIVRMKELARSYFWWPGLDRDIEEKANSCSSCQGLRNMPSPAPLHPWEWPASPWQRDHLDFAGPVEGVMVLVAVDAHSKWPEITVMPDITSEKTIQTLREMFARFGLPEQIVTDNGPSFVSQEMEEFLKGNGIKHLLSSPYHPSTNGLAERMVQTLKHALKASKSEAPFKQRLYTFLLKYRNTPHATTGMSPADLFLKRQLRTRLDWLRPATTQMRVYDKQHDQVKQRAKWAKDREFFSGDAVLARNYSTTEKWVPATILQKTGPVSYKVCTRDHQTWRRHVEQLLPSIPVEEAGSTETSEEPSFSELIQSQPGIPPDSPVSIPADAVVPRLPEVALGDEHTSAVRRNPLRSRKPPDRLNL